MKVKNLFSKILRRKSQPREELAVQPKEARSGLLAKGVTTKILPRDTLPYGDVVKIAVSPDGVLEIYLAHPQTIKAISSIIQMGKLYGLEIEKINQNLKMVQAGKLILK